MLTADVAIVGSGVAGARVATWLSKQGISVVILEAGPELASRSELMKKFAAGPIRHPGQPYPNPPQAPKPSPLDPHGYYVQEGPELFLSTAQLDGMVHQISTDLATGVSYPVWKTRVP